MPRVLPDPTAITAVMRDRYDIGVVALERVVGGWDSRAAVWVATADDGSVWSVKTTRRDVAFGLAVAASLSSTGVRGIVAPVAASDGALSVAVGDARLIVSPWVEGMDALDDDAQGVDWEEFGRTLRAVHEQPPPRTTRVRRGIRRLGPALEQQLRTVASDVADRGDDALRDRWRSAEPRLLRLLTAERELKARRRPAERVTLHGDPHLGNVVLDAAGRPWLIDFDEATVAPREVDLMLIEMGVLFTRPVTDADRRRFRRGYGFDVAVDEERIVRFGCVRAVEDALQTFSQALSDSSGDGLDYAYAIDGMFGPHGLVTLVEGRLAELDHAPAP